MRIGLVLRSLLRPGRKARRLPLRPSKRRPTFGVEGLDSRLLLSTATMLSATTVDSRGVTISYDVTTPTADPSLRFGVYRSAGPQLGPGAVPVAASLAAPAVDDSGGPADAPGVHRLTLPLAGGLPINPRHPYVLVVADPGSASAGQAGSVASFRKESIAVVTHGGLEYSAWKKDGPPWEREMAQSLRQQGYDRVIAYNWVAQSSTPGQAAKQAPRLTAMVLDAASQFPAGNPVDLQFIGHSEGAVVNTQAIVRIEARATPRIKAGFLVDTLLDPHAANPDFPGRQYSVGGPLGWIAKLAIDNYQAKARDPLVFIPAGVNSAQVFYQQTAVNRDHNTNQGIYNIWGQVPVPGQATYYNLTAADVVHSGKHGVYAWYEHHIVPTLGDGATQLAADAVSGTLANPTKPGGRAIPAGPATFSGTSAPGSTVLLEAGRGQGRLRVEGRAVAAADGSWTATTGPLAAGRYRVVAESHLPGWNPKLGTMMPTAPLGALDVGRGAKA